MSADARHKTRTLWLVGVLHAFTHVYHVVLMPLYLLIQRDLKFESVAEATSLVTILMTAYILPSYGLGVLADRLDRRGLGGLGGEQAERRGAKTHEGVMRGIGARDPPVGIRVHSRSEG